jgi:hypothetical protein
VFFEGPFGDTPSHEHFKITPKGRDFINRWLGAEDLERT